MKVFIITFLSIVMLLSIASCALDLTPATDKTSSGTPQYLYFLNDNAQVLRVETIIGDLQQHNGQPGLYYWVDERGVKHSLHLNGLNLNLLITPRAHTLTEGFISLDNAKTSSNPDLLAVYSGIQTELLHTFGSKFQYAQMSYDGNIYAHKVTWQDDSNKEYQLIVGGYAYFEFTVK